MGFIICRTLITFCSFILPRWKVWRFPTVVGLTVKWNEVSEKWFRLIYEGSHFSLFMILGIQIYHDYPSFLRFHLRYKVFSISRHYGWCHAWGSCRKMPSSWKLGSVIMWRVEQFENLCRQSQTFRFYRKLLCNVNDRELPNLMDRNWWIWEYNIIAAIHWKWKWSLFHVFLYFCRESDREALKYFWPRTCWQKLRWLGSLQVWLIS